MRHQHMARKAAVNRNAEMTLRRAQILLAVPASRAAAAADPWIDRDLAARLRGGVCADIGAGALDHAGDLVAEREGERAPRRYVELLVTGEPEEAVLYVQVGMAYAAPRNAHQDLRALRFRAIHDGLDERRPIGDERLAAQPGHHERPFAVPIIVFWEETKVG
jgi:hypothetical protein